MAREAEAAPLYDAAYMRFLPGLSQMPETAAALQTEFGQRAWTRAARLAEAEGLLFAFAITPQDNPGEPVGFVDNCPALLLPLVKQAVRHPSLTLVEVQEAVLRGLQSGEFEGDYLEG